MTSVDRVLSDYVDAWNAGERPDVDKFLERAPEDEREELADLIRTFLLNAPVPAYSEATLAQIQGEPAVKAAAGLLDEQSGQWPELLPRLRRAMKLKREEVVASLVELLGLKGEQARVWAYYHEMESGTLEPSGVSRRVLDALGRILGVSTRDLEDAGRFEATDLSLGAAYMRPLDGTMSGHLTAESLSYDSPGAAPEEWDEVDRLFRGGRETE